MVISRSSPKTSLRSSLRAGSSKSRAASSRRSARAVSRRASADGGLSLAPALSRGGRPSGMFGGRPSVQECVYDGRPSMCDGGQGSAGSGELSGQERMLGERSPPLPLHRGAAACARGGAGGKSMEPPRLAIIASGRAYKTTLDSPRHPHLDSRDSHLDPWDPSQAVTATEAAARSGNRVAFAPAPPLGTSGQAPLQCETTSVYPLALSQEVADAPTDEQAGRSIP